MSKYKPHNDKTGEDEAGLPVFPYREELSSTDMKNPTYEGVMTNIQVAFTGEADLELERQRHEQIEAMDE